MTSPDQPSAVPQSLSGDEQWVYDYLRRVAGHDTPRWDVAAASVVAGMRAQVAGEIARAIESLTGTTVCQWTRAEAAATARDLAVTPDGRRRRLRTALAEELADLRAAPSVRREDSTAGDSGTRVVIRGNACCGGDGDEASCEVCR